MRQWSDHRASLDVSALAGGALLELAALCGQVLAKAHARTGDAAVLAGYCGRGERLDAAVARFALAYADQTEADHARFRKALQLFERRAPGAGAAAWPRRWIASHGALTCDVEHTTPRDGEGSSGSRLGDIAGGHSRNRRRGVTERSPSARIARRTEDPR